MFKLSAGLKEQKGFTLIELLIVIAIISILAAAVIPGYLGMKERVKKMVIIASAATAESELQAWLNSALKGGGGPTSELREVDSNGDAVITSDDASNAQLGIWLSDGVLASQYVSARTVQYKEKSPWFPASNMWVNDVALAGHIMVSIKDTFPFMIRLEGRDKLNNPLHIKTLYSD